MALVASYNATLTQRTLRLQNPVGRRLADRQYLGIDTAARINRFRDRVVVIAENHDHVARCVDPADDADMAAAPAARHHRERADLRAGDPLAVARVVAGEIAPAFMPGLLQHHVHE